MREKIKELVQQALNDWLHTKQTDHKHILILLAYESINSNSVIQNIKEISTRHKVTLCLSNEWKSDHQEALTNTNLIHLEDCSKEKLHQVLDQVDLLYVPTISHGLIAKISLLIDDDIPSWIALQTQLGGKDIIIANDQMPSKGSSIFLVKPSIERRIQNYWRQIREDGIHVIPINKVQQKIANINQKKPVVLAKHIEKISIQGEKELTLPMGSILTPMGKDVAKELGITVKRENDEKRDQN